MANLNKVMLIGRLTRDPEGRTFQSGGKVAVFGFAVNNRKKNQSSGELEDDPVFLDCEVFNRATGRKLADVILDNLRKGAQVYLEGHLKLNQWQKDGQKHQRLILVVDDFQFLEKREEGHRQPSDVRRRESSLPDDSPPYHDEPDASGDIPF